jgi:hypothetical protein
MAQRAWQSSGGALTRASAGDQPRTCACPRYAAEAPLGNMVMAPSAADVNAQQRALKSCGLVEG